MAQTGKLIHAAAALGRRAPPEWLEFLKALQEHTNEMRDHVVQAPADKLFVAQGEARQAVFLFDLLRKAVNESNRLSKLSK